MPIRNLQDFVFRTLGLTDRGGNPVSLRINEPHLREFNLRPTRSGRQRTTRYQEGSINIQPSSGESRSRFRVDEPHSRDVLLELNESGISRTNVPDITKDSKIDMSGADGFSVLVTVLSPNGNKNEGGFTPMESFFFYGKEKIDKYTGFAKEAGLILTATSAVSNSGIDKISRTKLVEPQLQQGIASLSRIPGAGNVNEGDTNKVFLYFTKESVKGKQNLWGNQNISTQPTFGGWVNPMHYITNPDNKNDKTGLPKELGDFPFNYNNKYGANYFNEKGPGVGTSDLILTTPKNKVDGPPNDGINSKKEVFEYFRDAKPDNIRIGGMEQYDFIHSLDRLAALDNPEFIAKDVYLASFVEVKDHDDPVMFGFDLLIDFETSPLFNGSILSFIETCGANSEEIKARKEIFQNFFNQFRRYFKLNTSTDSPELTGGTGSIVPVSNEPQQNRRVYKSFYLKKIAGLDFLVEGSVTNANDTVKSLVDYGKDLIKLTLYEDLTVNTGYLGMLYKMLSWSRLNGKQMIPENLLRFDCKIVINEVRNYNKILKNGNALEVYVDDMNKYIYGLYDCQFIFEKLSHGDDIDMWALQVEKDWDIAFNFKYSTLLFERYNPNKPRSIQKFLFDNKKENPISVEEKTTAPNLKFYDKFQPGAAPGTSAFTDATLRNQKRQLNDAAVGGDININSDSPNNIIQTNGFESVSINPDAGFALDFSPLDDVKAIEGRRVVDDPYSNFEQSESTSLETQKRITKNKDMLQFITDRQLKLDVGSSNRQTRLISRTFDSIVESRENIFVGVNPPSGTINQAPSFTNTTVEARFFNLSDITRLDKTLEKNNFERVGGSESLRQLGSGNYIFASLPFTNQKKGEEDAWNLIRGKSLKDGISLLENRQTSYIRNLTNGQSQLNVFVKTA